MGWPRSQVTCTEELAKFRRVVFEIRKRTDIQTCWSQYFEPLPGRCNQSTSQTRGVDWQLGELCSNRWIGKRQTYSGLLECWVGRWTCDQEVYCLLDATANGLKRNVRQRKEAIAMTVQMKLNVVKMITKWLDSLTRWSTGVDVWNSTWEKCVSARSCR